MENEKELMSLKATNGTVTLYEDRVTISRQGFSAIMTQGIAGDRTYFYSDLRTVEFRKPTFFANGYLKLIVAGTADVNAKVSILGTTTDQSLEDPNTVILRAFKKEVPILSEKMYNLLLEKIKENANKPRTVVTNQPSQISAADEILKYKNLLDSGVITQEEFEKKKQDLLK